MVVEGNEGDDNGVGADAVNDNATMCDSICRCVYTVFI